jgi:predicted SnoaL-like aldol condensation-catalyzing enzyme
MSMLRRVPTVLFGLVLVGCAPQEEASSPAPDWEAQIQAANDRILNQGDLEAISEFFLPDYLNHGVDGDVVGPEIIARFVGNLREAFPDIRVEIEVLSTAGDMVTWLRTHRGTHEGDLMGVPASGHEIVWQDIVVTRYQDGMIAEEWGVSELGGQLLDQMR